MYDHIHQKNNVIKTGLTEFDAILNGGIHVPSLIVMLAESNMGKSLIKSAISSNLITQNKKILYLHGELSEQYMAERLVRNILDLSNEELRNLTEKSFFDRFIEISKNIGNSIIYRRFAPGVTNVGHIRQLLRDLEIKYKFIPDLIMLDYLGLFAPLAVSNNAGSNEKGIVKCQELQALISDYNIPVFTSAQANRSGYGKSKLDPTNIADAIGIFAEADAVVGVTQTEEQREMPIPIYTWDLMKSRFGLNKQEATIGINYDKMRLINVGDENDSQVSKIREEKDRQVVNEATREINKKLKEEKSIKKYFEIEEW